MVSAIILAAGMSTRMGEQNKLLLPIGDETFISRVVDAALASNAGEVIVVLGHEKESVREAIGDREVVFMENSAYSTGMTSSIQAGVQAASDNATGFMICLSDMPMITVEEINLLLAEFKQVPGDSKIIIPTFESQYGNPVTFSSSFRKEILAHKNPNGCRGIITSNPDSVTTFEMPSSTVLKDVDTPDDFSSLSG